LDHVDGVLIDTVEHCEDVFVAALVDRSRSAMGDDHGDLVFLRHGTRWECRATAVRPGDEIDLVLDDQALDKRGRALSIALIVVILDLDLILFSTDIDAAALI